MHTKFCSQNLKGRYHSQDLGVDGKITEIGRCGLDASDSG